MILILVGLLLWSGAHFWKRIAPSQRAAMGDRGKGIVAVLSVAGIVAMVIGYRGAEGTSYWGRTPAMTGINNLLMVFAVYLYAASGAKTRIIRLIRHPQLTAVIVWGIAHLLVNGDTPSFLLFGGLIVWALAEIVVLTRAGAVPVPAHAVPIRKEATAAIATVVAFAAIAGIHALLGYNPFG